MNNRFIRLVVYCNWIILFLESLFGFILTEPAFARGIAFGGFITTINFHLLARTLRKTFMSGSIRTGSYNLVLAKYYLRFTVSGLVIFLLIQQKFVNPLGLFIGLSVVVTSMMIAAMVEFKKLIFKEAI